MEARAFEDGAVHHWIIDERGRWLIEVSADRRLSLERFEP